MYNLKKNLEDFLVHGLKNGFGKMEEQIKQVVHIYTVKHKIPLFKGEEQANSIEYIELEEVGNRIVAAKDLHVFTEVFTSREHLENRCNEYFKNHLVEGIVVRNFDHSFSAKIMNMEYDVKNN